MALVATMFADTHSYAQVTKRESGRSERIAANADSGQANGRPPSTTTIHWQGVPLHETLDRVRQTFQVAVFVDRRVDPNTRVTLDIAATSAEQALGGIADSCGLDIARLGKLLYLGPASAAGRLRPLANLRTRDAAKLPVDLRNAVLKRQPLAWPRLGEPRQLVITLAEQNGWRVVDADKIPHDLWSANELPDLNLAERLTVLLLGFDLTFEFRPEDHAIHIVPLEANVAPAPRIAREIARRRKYRTHIRRAARSKFIHYTFKRSRLVPCCASLRTDCIGIFRSMKMPFARRGNRWISEFRSRSKTPTKTSCLIRC